MRYPISMDSHYDALCGITEEELHTVFAEPITQMALKRKVSVDEIKTILKKQYDGYHFSGEMLDIPHLLRSRTARGEPISSSRATMTFTSSSSNWTARLMRRCVRSKTNSTPCRT